MGLTSKSPYRVEQTTDRQVNTLQQNARALTMAVTSLPWANGTVSGPVTFTAGQTLTLDHGLGRAVRGYLVIDCYDGYATFKRVPQTPLLDSKTVQLQSENACTATFWWY